ncbi:4-(cytidine 5'-diphospho)-2-C-methyl-D-erythritol kinase [Pantoea sp. Aalb]|uniref:4-(cytidine 5'-diphospho)-2-C-methyl-D-erythritol kinase n=1 Tax=Pantoea sp. Aalb TaxID=2576762 RepID=UPI0013235F44|nr:4-(cytidine 5'-diphospho)-2-C-methyl-D-erythritol kinase [Pantoea sp. Aalb]MXP67349.1 4-(cytidine 5'-diphospho)-2-C-methyl-D-erythritol kinase [Pantoea sp. Aalb]
MITTWPTPGKLNLFLYITGRRIDGYHNLQTLFQFLDYGDTLTIDINKKNKKIVLLTPIAGVLDEENLIIRAVKEMRKIAISHDKISSSTGVQITLKKRLPIGGGLGGGSSNAATILVALNYLWNIKLSNKELADIGLKLGADVPIFIYGHAAFAEGIGEQLKLVTPKEQWYLILNPNIKIRTSDLFNDPKLKRNSPIRTLDELLNQPFHNDCEELVRKKFHEIDYLMCWLKKYAPARLTGTGSCIFAEFNNEYDARKILELSSKYINGFVAHGLNISPLQYKLGKL